MTLHQQLVAKILLKQVLTLLIHQTDVKNIHYIFRDIEPNTVLLHKKPVVLVRWWLANHNVGKCYYAQHDQKNIVKLQRNVAAVTILNVLLSKAPKT